MTPQLISIIIPCYRSEKSISKVMDELVDLFSKQTTYDYEIIAINDSSPDKVWDVLLEYATHNKKIKVIDLAVNCGKHRALLAGFSFVSGEYIVTLDDDDQCPIDLIWELVKPLSSGYDMAIAKYNVKKESKLKVMGSNVNNLMSRWIFNKPSNIVFSNFIARKRFVVDAMTNYHLPYAYLEGLSLQITRNIAMVEMQERKGQRAKSGFTLSKSFSLLLNGYTTFSTKPIHIIGYSGVVMFISSLVYFIVLLINAFASTNIDYKYHLLFAVFLFVMSLLFLSLQLLGEYIGRILVSQHSANQFVIRQKVNI